MLFRRDRISPSLFDLLHVFVELLLSYMALIYVRLLANLTLLLLKIV